MLSGGRFRHFGGFVVGRGKWTGVEERWQWSLNGGWYRCHLPFMMSKDKSPHSCYKRMVRGSIFEGEVSLSSKPSNFGLVLVQTVCNRNDPSEDYHSSLVVVKVTGDESPHSGVA